MLKLLVYSMSLPSSALPCQRVLLPFHLVALGRLVQPSLSLDAVKVDAVSSQSGLIHSSQLMLNIHKDHPSGIPTCKIPQDVVPPDYSFIMSPPCRSQHLGAHWCSADGQYRAVELLPESSK